MSLNDAMMPRIRVPEKPMLSILRRWSLVFLFCSLAGSLTLVLQAQQTQTVTQGVYTDTQALRGQVVYKARCSNCHGDALGGRTGPPLTGNDFNGIWSRQPLSELVKKILNTMPKDDSAKLTRQETADIVAFMLQTDKFPSGRTELQTDDAALQQISLPAPAAAATKTFSGTPAPFPPVGNLAQVMRGMLFPSSNIVFTTQSIDPGAKKTATDTDPLNTGGFDWLTWGGSIYKGWDLVDYASVALGESATLMLTPGRRCENGRLVPVDDPDWLKFTTELSEAGRAAYKASQTRDQAKASDVTNQVNDACSNCHRVFRGRTHCVK
jgi:S-disulfanyl-L-cysteine oxidoreductase SoxD